MARKLPPAVVHSFVEVDDHRTDYFDREALIEYAAGAVVICIVVAALLSGWLGAIALTLSMLMGAQ
ncbi:MAG TPA: hypothetical protein PLT25_11965 [Acidocella sp.]|nr:hypothetical protein [Acidocella sp.]